MRTATRILQDQQGVTLVSSMLILSLLAIFALVAAGIAVNERRTSYNDSVYTRAFMAADSGGEAAIAFIRESERPPAFEDFEELRVSQIADQNLMEGINGVDNQEFDYAIRMPDDGDPFRPVMPRAGFSSDGRFLDYYYNVNAAGEAGQEGSSTISLVVSKLFQDGYN